MTVDTLFSWLGGLIPAMEGSGILLVIAILIPCLVLFLVVAVNAIVMVYAERKVSAFMQDRVGPMGQGVGLHAGKWGLLQTVADALKLGRQAYLQRRINSEASIGKLLFNNGFKMLQSRGLTDAGEPMLAERRLKQSHQLRDLLRRLDLIRAIGVARRGS